MSRCFGTSSDNLSAKEYIHKKRNTEVFCDLRNKYRNSKSFSEADAIRKELLAKGITLLDSKNGRN